MSITLNELRNILEKSFPNSKVVVHSLVDDGEHYSIQIQSKLFKGKNKIEQHRMVYDALNTNNVSIHALQISTNYSESYE